jgi:hypothetical protein
VDNPSEQSWIPNTDSYDIDGRYMLSKGREKVRSENMYKTSDERETSFSPCSADEMTMNYLQEIETEWAESKGFRSKWNNENDSITNECVTLPNVETFVGSDTTVSPNRWIPSLEVKKCAIDKSKTRNFNDIDAERNKIVESDDQMSDTFVSKKFLTLPRSHKLNPSSAEGVGYSTIPRMRPDVQTNKARDKQIHTNRSEANFGNFICWALFRHLCFCHPVMFSFICCVIEWQKNGIYLLTHKNVYRKKRATKNCSQSPCSFKLNPLLIFGLMRTTFSA